MIPLDVGQRTLEIWLTMKSVDHSNMPIVNFGEGDDSGSRPANGKWDGIGFGATRGVIGPRSEFNHRAGDAGGGRETSGPTELLHLAAVYAKDNTVTLYRNGAVLGQPFLPEPRDADHNLVTYRKDTSFLGIGGSIAMDVDEIRLYTRALTAAEIAASYRTFKK